MPIEIKELHIKAVINEGADSASSSAAAPSGESDTDKDDIIAECVEKVLEILRQQRER